MKTSLVFICMILSTDLIAQEYRGHPSIEDYHQYQKDSLFFEWITDLHKKHLGYNPEIEAIIQDSTIKSLDENHLTTHHIHQFGSRPPGYDDRPDSVIIWIDTTNKKEPVFDRGIIPGQQTKIIFKFGAPPNN